LQDKINILKSQTNSQEIAKPQSQQIAKPQSQQINKEPSLVTIQKKMKDI
jgi:hypothetical protein